MVLCMTLFQLLYQSQSWCMILQLPRITQSSWIFLRTSGQRYSLNLKITPTRDFCFPYSLVEMMCKRRWLLSYKQTRDTCFLILPLRVINIGYTFIIFVFEIYSKEMVKEKKMLYSFDPTKKARFGVLPRYAKDELMIKWFELPNCFIFHNGVCFYMSV